VHSPRISRLTTSHIPEAAAKVFYLESSIVQASIHSHVKVEKKKIISKIKSSMRLHFLPLSCLLVIATSGSIAYASSGDRSDAFQRCLDKCVRQSCTATYDDGSGSGSRARPVHAQQQQQHQQPLALRLTRWSCADDCKYTCMHMLTDFALESGVRVEQYYGKWPFWRFAGMQEPASVVFSVANLLMHVLGLDWLRRGVHPAHPMKPFYITWAYLSINAWVWSAVFHTRGV
jgi:post-GPI attachment to proteins factor 3